MFVSRKPADDGVILGAAVDLTLSIDPARPNPVCVVGKQTQNLEAMGDGFDAKRRLIEALDLRVTLVVEEGQQLIYARCLLDEDVFLTSSTIIVRDAKQTWV